MDNYSAVQFIEDCQRLCGKNNCFRCPLYDKDAEECVMVFTEVEERIELVRKWAKDNPIEPVKTYAEDFFEKFPNAIKRANGTPKACMHETYGVERRSKCFDPHVVFNGCTICAECWSRPMEGEE